MISFDEELRKFHPSLEVEDVAETIYNLDMTDGVDLLVGMIQNAAPAQPQPDDVY